MINTRKRAKYLKGADFFLLFNFFKESGGNFWPLVAVRYIRIDFFAILAKKYNVVDAGISREHWTAYMTWTLSPHFCEC